MLQQVSGAVLSLALIRRWPELQGRLVFMSGDPGLVVEGWPAELRGCPVLTKPFQLEELFGMLSQVLSRLGPPPREASGGQ
jgi:hypothetical protein